MSSRLGGRGARSPRTNSARGGGNAKAALAELSNSPGIDWGAIAEAQANERRVYAQVLTGLSNKMSSLENSIQEMVKSQKELFGICKTLREEQDAAKEKESGKQEIAVTKEDFAAFSEAQQDMFDNYVAKRAALKKQFNEKFERMANDNEDKFRKFTQKTMAKFDDYVTEVQDLLDRKVGRVMPGTLGSPPPAAKAPADPRFTPREPAIERTNSAKKIREIDTTPRSRVNQTPKTQKVTDDPKRTTPGGEKALDGPNSRELPKPSISRVDSRRKRERAVEDDVEKPTGLLAQMTAPSMSRKANIERMKKRRQEAIEARKEKENPRTREAMGVTRRQKSNKSSEPVKRQKSSKMRDRLGVPKYDASRKGSYRFGSATMHYIKPTEGYPTPDEYQQAPYCHLELETAHGYCGAEEYGRQNLHLAKDPSGTCDPTLLYNLAGAGVCYDTKATEKFQRFYVEHTDDCTTIAYDPRKDSELVATGQVEPKDGTSFIKIWDWRTLDEVAHLKDAHWGMVYRIQFSHNNDFLYSIGGDDAHSFYYWNIKEVRAGNKARNIAKNELGTTTKEVIYGFTVSPKDQTGAKNNFGDGEVIDEFVIFGRQKALWGQVYKQPVKKGSKKMQVRMSSKAVLTARLPELKKNKKLVPSAFLCAEYLETGDYILGGTKGALYICSRNQCIQRVECHAGYIGCCVVDEKMIITAGVDSKMRKFFWTKGSDGKYIVDQTLETPDHMEIDGHDFEFKPRAMCYDKDLDVMYVGSKTCQIMRYDFKQHETRQVLIDGHDGAIWGLATCPVKGYEHYYLTGGHDNVVKLWDADKRKVVDTYEFEIPEGDKGEEVMCAVWSNDGRYIAVGTMASNLYLLTWEDQNDGKIDGINKLACVTAFHIGAKEGRDLEEIAQLRFSPSGNELAVAHMDSNMYIFTIEPEEDPESGIQYVQFYQWAAIPHRAAPTHIQWSEDGSFVKTFTRDYEISHFVVDSKSRRTAHFPFTPDPDKVEWSDDPLIAGWEVEGCYQQEWDGTDLNDVTLSNDSKFCFTGDDFGLVRVHNYPAISNDPAHCEKYAGHSSFVVGVEMCRDDKFLISVGGNDMAIFQWKITKGAKPEKQKVVIPEPEPEKTGRRGGRSLFQNGPRTGGSSLFQNGPRGGARSPGGRSRNGFK